MLRHIILKCVPIILIILLPKNCIKKSILFNNTNHLKYRNMKQRKIYYVQIPCHLLRKFAERITFAKVRIEPWRKVCYRVALSKKSLDNYFGVDRTLDRHKNSFYRNQVRERFLEKIESSLISLESFFHILLLPF